MPLKRSDDEVQFVSSNPVKKQKLEDPGSRSTVATVSRSVSLNQMASPQPPGKLFCSVSRHLVTAVQPGTPASLPLAPPPENLPMPMPPHMADNVRVIHASSLCNPDTIEQPGSPGKCKDASDPGETSHKKLPESFSSTSLAARGTVQLVNPTQAQDRRQDPKPEQTINPSQELPSSCLTKELVAVRRLTSSDAPHDIVPVSDGRRSIGTVPTGLPLQPCEQASHPGSLPAMENFTFAQGLPASSDQQPPSPPPLSPKQLPTNPIFPATFATPVSRTNTSLQPPSCSNQANQQLAEGQSSKDANSNGCKTSTPSDVSVLPTAGQQQMGMAPTVSVPQQVQKQPTTILAHGKQLGQETGPSLNHEQLAGLQAERTAQAAPLILSTPAYIRPAHSAVTNPPAGKQGMAPLLRQMGTVGHPGDLSHHQSLPHSCQICAIKNTQGFTAGSHAQQTASVTVPINYLYAQEQRQQQQKQQEEHQHQHQHQIMQMSPSQTSFIPAMECRFQLLLLTANK